MVADATPIHYLILLNEIDLLYKLYGRVVLPAAVIEELSAPKAPTPVRQWIGELPLWVSSASALNPSTLAFPSLGRGEREAISLAKDAPGSILLTDDLQARRAAASIGLQTVPTIRILSTAADLSFVDLDEMIARLQQTNFRLSRKLLKTIVRKPMTDQS